MGGLSPHGTRSCYTFGGCRCAACRTAVREYERQRRRRLIEEAHGTRPPRYVDTAEVRAHIAWLRSEGIGYKRIGRLAGIPSATMGRLAGYNRGDRPQNRILATSAARILAIRPDLDNLAGSALIDGAPSGRRLRALAALGWTNTEMGRRIGVTVTNFGPLIAGTGKIQAATARRIAALYDELHMTPAPDSPGATRARNRAAAAGWLPPLAWDDIDTGDLPEPEPKRDGRVRCYCDDVEHLLYSGESADMIAARLGIGRDRVLLHVRRHGRDDLADWYAA